MRSRGEQCNACYPAAKKVGERLSPHCAWACKQASPHCCAGRREGKTHGESPGRAVKLMSAFLSALILAVYARTPASSFLRTAMVRVPTSLSMSPWTIAA